MSFVDRSNVNGADNYVVARKAGLAALYLKVSQGVSFVDKTYDDRRLAANAAGIKLVGGYHFAALDDPVAEANFFLAQLHKPRAGELLPVLDLERGSVVSDVKWAEAFVQRVKAVLGYYPVLYGSTSLIAPMRAQSAILRACPWWRAEYGVNDGVEHPLQGGAQGAALHQFTSVGKFPGISGNTDMNHFLRPTAMIVPHRKMLRRLPSQAWVWAQWYLGIGRFKGLRREMKFRPRVPRSVPKRWCRAVQWYRQHVLHRPQPQGKNC